jgi:FtsP/CotA-like multicopper oxidase with cupredoxin domain
LGAAIAVAGCGDDDGGSAGPPPVGFSNPAVVASADGVLATTLTIEAATQTVAAEEITFPELYNGLYTPPTLQVEPGDMIKLRLRNFGYQSTNLHYHGLAVTPMGTGDNVFLELEAGLSFDYEFPIPADHAQGMFWYHPHLDPMLNTQLSGGMAGALIVGDILEPFPQLASIPERVMLLKDLKTVDGFPMPDPDPAGPTTRTINGLFKPQITMQPGQLEFWRIGNFSSNIYYQLTLGGQPFHVIAEDGNLQNQLVTTETLEMPPGKRFEVLVYGPAAGTYELETADFNTGPDGDAYPGQVMARVVSQGAAVAPIDLPSTFPPVNDLRTETLTGSRTVVFADTANPDQFVIDGKPFNGNCVDQYVTLGAIEEWTIANTAQEAHVFHIHQVDFQVTEINGEPVPFTGHQDIVNLPPAPDDDTPSVVKVIIPFDNPVIVGEFVFHCHIIQHEVQGMMASIYVVDPATPPSELPPLCQPLS